MNKKNEFSQKFIELLKLLYVRKVVLLDGQQHAVGDSAPKVLRYYSMAIRPVMCWFVLMSSSENASQKRQKKYRPGRLEYLDQLVVEFQTTRLKDAKEQVLANLANFAFDPANYEYFRQLNILDLFLDNLSSKEESFIKFSIGGLCNLSLDPVNKDYITENGLKNIIDLLTHSNEDVILSTMTTLIFLHTPSSHVEITSPAVINSVTQLTKRKNVRLKNLASIFLKDYCTKDQIKQSENLAMNELSNIPLPDS